MSEFLAAFCVLFDSLLSRERSELGFGAKPRGLDLDLLSGFSICSHISQLRKIKQTALLSRHFAVRKMAAFFFVLNGAAKAAPKYFALCGAQPKALPLESASL